LKAPDIARAVQPGQFLNVRVSSGVDPLLRRPISVCDVRPTDVRLVFKVVGRGTGLLSRVRIGDTLDVLGPLGKPAPAVCKQDVLLCGGGIGAAPLLHLARRLRPENRVRVILGARDKSQLILPGEFRSLRVPVSVATDNGSAGFHGTVAALAESEVKGQGPKVKRQATGRRSAAGGQPSAVFACGPAAMLAALARRLDPIPVWGFIEDRMGCGTGVCYCCALLKRGGGHVRFCEEGPVVLLNEVVL
jgi:dihydroorotate dehydrogenase electron transfer subunit